MKNSRARVIIPVCAVCCAVLLGVGVWKSGLLRKDSGTNNTGDKTGQTTVAPTGQDNSQATPTVTTAVNATPTAAPPKLEGSKELTAGASEAPAMTKEMDDAMRAAYETFTYKLFAQLPEGKTRMISPFSIYVALSMLSDGADGETLAQLDELLGLTAEERHAYLAAWIEELTTAGVDGTTTFTNADSLWIKDGLESVVSKDFLDICAQYYRATVYSTPMDDSSVRDINAWVKAKTSNMIEKHIDELDESVTMILMNAIALDASWEEEFEKTKTQKDYTFTKEDGTTVKVDMMFGYLSDGYLENDLATGFFKGYKGNEFSYVALLPKEGVSLEQLIASLAPSSIRELIDNELGIGVNIGIPKYEKEYTIELCDVLKELGVADAFEGNADFTRLMSGIFVGEVLHKTYISVDEKGTKAAAVSEVGMWKGGTEEYTLTLDRPFVYMIIDSDRLPVFIGTYEG